ncbi:unnamed protein product [Soboliphyme baturini]|uniref:Neur_chan_LBD domain-containing protein n=1 Tax=Soboliphyme baturini TaxID=241478 RepID=A0A183J929_9BILA|nr:unnamed protein product [Soboliphyme baturini]
MIMWQPIASSEADIRVTGGIINGDLLNGVEEKSVFDSVVRPVLMNEFDRSVIRYVFKLFCSSWYESGVVVA